MNDIGISIGLQGAAAYNRELSNIEGRTTNAASRMRSGVNNLASSFPALGSAISFITNPVVAFGAAIAGATSAVSGFITQAAKAETTKASFEVLTGSAERAEKTLASLQKFAASTPFQLPEIQDSARKLIAFGTAAEDTTSVIQRIGNIAAGVDAPLTELSEIYGKIQVQGRVFAEDINQLTGRGIPIIQELAKQFGVTSSQVRQLVTDGKVGFPQIEQAFISLTSNGGQFEGLIERLSTTYNGKLSTLRDNFAALQRQFGEALLPIATALLDRTLSLVQSLGDMNQFLYDNAEAIGIATTAMVAFVAPSIISGLSAMITAIRGVTLSQLSLNAAFAANPIGVVVVAVGLLTTAFIALYKRSQPLRAAIAGLGAFFIELGNIIKNGFLKIIEGAGTSFEGLLNLDFNQVKSGIKNAIEGVLDANILTTAFKNGERLANAFSVGYQDKIIEEINEGTKKAIEGSGDSATQTATNTGAGVGAAFGKSFAKQAIETISTDIPAFLSSNAGKILAAFDNIRPDATQVRTTSLATPDNTEQVSALIQQLGLDLQFVNSTFASTNDLLDAMSSTGFRVAEALGASTQSSLAFAASLQNFKQNAFENTINIVGNAVEGLGRQLGEAVKAGKSTAEAFAAFAKTIVAQGLKYLGLFLLNSAATLGFPAGIPFAVAGALLLGASGFVSGLGGARSQQQSSLPSVDASNVTGNLSQNSVNQAQGANLGLSNQFQQRTPQTVVYIQMDGEEISQRVVSNIETNNILQGSGFN